MVIGRKVWRNRAEMRELGDLRLAPDLLDSQCFGAFVGVWRGSGTILRLQIYVAR